MSYCYVFFRSQGSDKLCVGFWEASKPADFYTKTLDAITLSENPSAVAFNNKLYCFYQGPNNNGELWYSTLDQNGLTACHQVPITQLACHPAAVVVNNQIYCFYQSRNNKELWYTLFDGQQWQGSIQVRDITLSETPSAVVLKEKIYCFYQGPNNNGELWYSTVDSEGTWVHARLLGTQLLGNPAAAVCGDNLYCFYRNGKDNELKYNVLDGNHWQREKSIPGTRLSDGPAAVVVNSRKIYCCYQEQDHKGAIGYSVVDVDTHTVQQHQRWYPAGAIVAGVCSALSDNTPYFTIKT